MPLDPKGEGKCDAPDVFKELFEAITLDGTSSMIYTAQKLRYDEAAAAGSRRTGFGKGGNRRERRSNAAREAAARNVNEQSAGSTQVCLTSIPI